jgi:hypothetical protein
VLYSSARAEVSGAFAERKKMRHHAFNQYPEHMCLIIMPDIFPKKYLAKANSWKRINLHLKTPLVLLK